ncbi:hypothetical protein SB776_39605, partial [Burkholderia sp. SIMBA_045]
MTPEEAHSRIAAQATRQARNEAADVVLDNAGDRNDLLAAVDALWTDRLVAFAENISRGTRASRQEGPVIVESE